MPVTSKIRVCPICGKIPKAKRNWRGQTVLECKPRFGQAHLSVLVGKADFCSQNSKAIRTWNSVVETYLNV